MANSEVDSIIKSITDYKNTLNLAANVTAIISILTQANICTFEGYESTLEYVKSQPDYAKPFSELEEVLKYIEANNDSNVIIAANKINI